MAPAAALRTAAALVRRRLLKQGYALAAHLSHPEVFASSSPSLRRFYHEWQSFLLNLPAGCQAAPVGQLSFTNFRDWASERYMWIDAYLKIYPMFGLIQDNPLITDTDAWEFLSSGRFFLGSLIGIASHNHDLGISIAPSITADNIRMSPHFMHATFINPVGIPLDESKGITRRLAYIAIAELIWKLVNKHYPHVTLPKEFLHIMSKLQGKLDYPESEELLVVNPSLLQDDAMINFIQSADHLMRKICDCSSNQHVRGISAQVYDKIGNLKGPDHTKWEVRIAADPFFDDIYRHNYGSSSLDYPNTTLGPIARGRRALTVQRIGIVHYNEIVKRLPEGTFTAEPNQRQVVQAIRYNAPLTAPGIANSMVSQQKLFVLGMRNFFPMHPNALKGPK